MSQLPNPQLTKQDEIDTFKDFVKRQPAGSYLDSILTTILPDVCQAIRNDFGFISWTEIYKAQSEHRKTVDEHAQHTRALDKDKRKTVREIDALQVALNELRTDARRLARLAG